MSGFSDVERACGYTFKNKELLKRALTLSSYDNVNNNESLECLGDALLTFIVAEKYYAENLSEGGITAKKQQLISDEALRPVSVRLG
ncbi:MAG: ribonuclease III, partial [Clostridia bacterium]|nr:ribonuclease III [Clostridia bacterium]